MNLNDLLVAKSLNPEEILVFRHRPNEPQLRKILPRLAAEEPEVFNAYQQTHGLRVENAMRSLKQVVSFIGHAPGKALFVGAYAIGAAKQISRDEFWNIPAYAKLKPFGMRGFADEDDRKSVLWFDLTLTDFYADWKGKLVVDWPGLERSWWRRAHNNDFRILAIHEESALGVHMPSWDSIDLSWAELSFLPSSWRTRLSEWRAIYYIFDVSDGKGYVGSACGSENLLRRWLEYAASGHGGNRQLRQRDPSNFRFSILQRVSPDMEADEVIRLEGSWKDRLHTRTLGLNDN